MAIASGPDRLAQLFDHHLDVGLHHGAQLAVYHEGDLVVDLAGGQTAPDPGEFADSLGDGDPEPRSVEPTTRFLLWSCTKPIAATCVHHLVERGLLDYDDRVVDHWPCYADDGPKAETTVDHVLTHRAGLPAVELDARPELWDDPDAVATAMAEAEVEFEPGSTAAYHSLSFGWLVGELVRRVADATIDEYAREHVLDPLGLADTSIGVGDGDPEEVATIVGYRAFDRCRSPGVGLDSDRPAGAALFNRPAVQRALVPAGNGVGTARDLARLFACLAGEGSVGGDRLLAPETVRAATELRVAVEHDATLGVPRRYARGFERAGLPQDKYGALAPRRVFGHGGFGSIVAWADPREDLAVAYVTNGVRDEFEHAQRTATLSEAVRTVFGGR
jgi:CubicO group peptidase (beta-lactamase class C family)